MKLGIVISRTEPETVWNALRLGNFARKAGDDVSVFLLGPGVDAISNTVEKFNVEEQAQTLHDAGGLILACGTCLKIRNREGTETCPLSTMKDLYEIVRDSDRVLTF
jgi:uncharacterized protein involved in oxidation of intracellular sulfur